MGSDSLAEPYLNPPNREKTGPESRTWAEISGGRFG